MKVSKILSIDILLLEVKSILLDVANLPDLSIETLDVDMPLFDEGLGLDSIDVLELVVRLDRNYGLKIKNDEKGRHVLRNVRCIAEAIHQQQVQLHG